MLTGSSVKYCEDPSGSLHRSGVPFCIAAACPPTDADVSGSVRVTGRYGKLPASAPVIDWLYVATPYPVGWIVTISARLPIVSAIVAEMTEPEVFGGKTRTAVGAVFVRNKPPS